MMYRILFFLLLCSGSLHAQKIEIYKVFGGLRFERDTVPISAKQVHTILEDVPEAHAIFTKARGNSAVASILGFSGGILIGFPLGTALIGGDPEWGLALAGAALIGVSIPFNKAFERYAADAVDQYNQKKPAGLKAHGEVFFSSAGVGVKITF